MKKLFVLLMLSCLLPSLHAEVLDSIWFNYNDRFTAPQVWQVSQPDSLTFSTSTFKVYADGRAKRSVTYTSISAKDKGEFTLYNPGRYLGKPNGYSSCNYESESSQFCFKRSMESEHFVCFWENGISQSGNVISYDGTSVDVKKLLTNAEKIFRVYVDELGFLTPGKSVTDKTKIHMYIVKNGWGGAGDTWRADGSGQDGVSYKISSGSKTQVNSPVALFHCTTRAAEARNGHTPAHEIGHSFQWLVARDFGTNHGFGYGLGSGNDNEWWEDCANWQAYKVYPEMQFTDGEYYEQYLAKHHMNIHHEDARYANCYYHDYWCQMHGKNTIGRIWRETDRTRGEDPTQTYMRLFGLNEETFGDEQWQAYAHLAALDIEGIHSNSQSKIGNEPQRLIAPSQSLADKYLDGKASEWWVVDPAYCPENYGYNANPLKVPAAGTKVRVDFRGIAGCEGYGNTYVERAGWRYGLVAYCKDGTRHYTQPQRDKDGSVEMIVPEGCKNMWLVVMGAPTKYWTHSWTSGVPSSNFPENGEQWPYAVKVQGTSPLGASRIYGEFPDDYARRDTTVVIEANLAYSSSAWSSVRVQLDTDAISEALGVSTDQLHNAVCGKKTSAYYPYVRIAGLSSNLTTENNTKTISDTDVIFGHWFSTLGNVVSSISSGSIYTKIYHDTYGCYVGQNPGKLTRGKTYVVREAVIYTDKNGKQYRAIMEIHLNVI